MSEVDARGYQPDTILVARSPGETRYALLAEETLLSLVHRRDVDVQPGAVYHARVRAPVPGVGAVFVDYGQALPGVLHVKSPPPEGSAVAVSVAVPPRPGKGAELKPAKASIAAGAKLPALAAAAPEPVADWFARYGASVRAIVCQPLREVARDVLDISRGGLARRDRKNREGYDETGFLAPLEEVVARGSTSAEEMLKAYNTRWGGSIEPVFLEYAY